MAAQRNILFTSSDTFAPAVYGVRVTIVEVQNFGKTHSDRVREKQNALTSLLSHGRGRKGTGKIKAAVSEHSKLLQFTFPFYGEKREINEMTFRKPNGRTAAYTLVEIMIVVGLIALLAT